MGDAPMAFFGAPVARADHAARACRAALAMMEELGRLNDLFHREGLLQEGVALRLGVGLNTGEMVVGNRGSYEVFAYTVLGDAVNLGSRLEGCNKLYGTAILVAEATAEAAGHDALTAFRARRFSESAVAFERLVREGDAPAAYLAARAARLAEPPSGPEWEPVEVLTSK